MSLSISPCLCGASPNIQYRQRNFGLWPDLWQARMVCAGGAPFPHELHSGWVEAGHGVERGAPALHSMAAFSWNALVSALTERVAENLAKEVVDVPES